MKQIIGFSGRKRCGKGAISEYMQKQYGARVVTVAAPLKRLCSEMIDVNIETLNRLKDSQDMSMYVYDTLSVDRAANVIHKYFDEVKPSELKTIVRDALNGNRLCSVRDLLQFVGTDIIRRFNPNWHVEQLVASINEIDDGLVVIDDVRFPNELKAVKDLGGTVFFIIRPDLSIPISNHSSEIGLHWYDFDDNRIIVNDSSLLNLVTKFEMYYLSRFSDDENSILLSGMHYLDNERTEYGLPFDRYTDVNELKERLKSDKLLREYGIISINATSVREVDRCYRMFYREKPKQVFVPTNFTIRNPFIIENMKELIDN